MAEEVSIRVVFSDPKGAQKVSRVLKGTIKEIDKELANMDTKRLAGTFRNGARQADLARREIARLAKANKLAGESTLVLGRATQVVEKRQDKNNKSYFVYIDLLGRTIRTSKAVYEQSLKTNNAIQLKSTKKGIMNLSTMQKKLKQAFSTNITGMINNQRQMISKLNTTIRHTGKSTELQREKIKQFTDNITKLSQVDIKSVVKDFDNLNDSLNLDEAMDDIKEFIALEKGMVQATAGLREPAKTKPKNKPGPSGGGGGAAIVSQLSGAFGFGAIDLGLQIQNLFTNKRLNNQISSAGQSLASTIGRVFGGLAGSIAGDIGKAAGTVGELIFNAFTMNLRVAGVAIGGLIRGLGITIASGFVGAVVGGVTGPQGAIIGALTGIVISVSFALIAAIQELVSEVLDIIGKLFKTMVSLISASLKVVALAIGAGMKIVGAVWKATWTSLKEVVKVVFESTIMLAKQFSKALVSTTAVGLQEFLKLEKGAARAAKEIVNQGNLIGSFINQINSMRIQGGFEAGDVNLAFFTAVSAGFRETAERQKIMGESARLAIADQSGLANATNALITVYANYGEKLSDITGISDLLAKTTTLGVTSLEELGPALKSVVGTAKFAGVGLQDLFASVSSLTKVFGKGSTRSVTKFLSRFIESIAFPTSRAAKSFKELGVSIKDLGGGSFSDKFVKLLEKLKGGISPDKLREFFPLAQARRAFLGLTNDIGRFKSLLNQFKNLPNLKAKQVDLLMKTIEKRMKQIITITKIGREMFGRVAAKIAAASILSNKFMKIWLRIGAIFSSASFVGALNNLARQMFVTVIPGFNILEKAANSFSAVLRNIAGQDTFSEFLVGADGIFRQARKIANIIGRWNTSLQSGISLTGMMKIGLATIKAGVDEILFVFQKLDTKEITFASTKDNVLALGKSIQKILTDSLSLGINSIAGFSLDAAKFFQDVNSKDFTDKLTPEQAGLFSAFKNLFTGIGTLIRVIFRRIWDLVLGDMRTAFLSLNGIIADQLNKTLDVLLLALDAAGALEATATSATNLRERGSLNDRERFDSIRGRPDYALGQAQEPLVAAGDAARLSAALIKSGIIPNDSRVDEGGERISRRLEEVAGSGQGFTQKTFMNQLKAASDAQVSGTERAGEFNSLVGETGRFLHLMNVQNESMRTSAKSIAANILGVDFVNKGMELINRPQEGSGKDTNFGRIAQAIKDLRDPTKTRSEVGGRTDLQIKANESSTNKIIAEAQAKIAEGTKNISKSFTSNVEEAGANPISESLKDIGRNIGGAAVDQTKLEVEIGKLTASLKNNLAISSRNKNLSTDDAVSNSLAKSIDSVGKNIGGTASISEFIDGLREALTEVAPGATNAQLGKIMMSAMKTANLGTQAQRNEGIAPLVRAHRIDERDKKGTKDPVNATGVKPTSAGKRRGDAKVSRFSTGAMGVDTVNARLQPGEAVIPRDAVQHFGSDYMRQIINKHQPDRFATGSKGSGGKKGSGRRKGSILPTLQSLALDGPQTKQQKAGIEEKARFSGFLKGYGEELKKASIANAKRRKEELSNFNKFQKSNAENRKRNGGIGGNMRTRLPDFDGKMKDFIVEPVKDGLDRLFDVTKQGITATDSNGKILKGMFALGKEFKITDMSHLGAFNLEGNTPRNNSTRQRGVQNARNGASQFGQGATFSGKFRNGFSGFSGGNAAQLVKKANRRRNAQAGGFIDPAINKPLPDKDTNQMVTLLTSLLAEQKKANAAFADEARKNKGQAVNNAPVLNNAPFPVGGDALRDGN